MRKFYDQLQVCSVWCRYRRTDRRTHSQTRRYHEHTVETTGKPKEKNKHQYNNKTSEKPTMTFICICEILPCVASGGTSWRRCICWELSALSGLRSPDHLVQKWLHSENKTLLLSWACSVLETSKPIWQNGIMHSCQLILERWRIFQHSAVTTLEIRSDVLDQRRFCFYRRYRCMKPPGCCRPNKLTWLCLKPPKHEHLWSSR